MNYKEVLQVDISGVIVSFNCKPEIINYLAREFKGLIVSGKKNVNISVNIKNEKYHVPNTASMVGESIFIDKNNIIQRIRSKGNRVWLVYTIKGGLPSTVDVYIPYSIKNNISKLFHPTFLCKWKVSVINFIHGPFIGIVELYLIEKESTFFHASALSLNTKYGIAITGEGQTGKSSFVKWLTDNKDISVVSEDFCIINANNRITSYPKQSRVKIKSLKSYLQYYRGLNTVSIIDIFNFVIYYPLRIIGVRSLRILSFDEIFNDCMINYKAELKKIICINRNTKLFSVEQRSKEDFISFCEKNMMIEFNNIVGFSEFLMALNVLDIESLNENDISVRLKLFFGSLYDRVDCVFANIPYYDDIQLTKKLVIELIYGDKKKES